MIVSANMPHNSKTHLPQQSKLKNGLFVTSQDIPFFESVVLHITFPIGAKDELKNEHGMAHMLEHMAFKGTKTRNAKDIAEEIEKLGGDLNASTSHESTSYYVHMLKDDICKGVEILSDIILNPTFDNTEFLREKNVIIEEIKSAQDTPDDVVFDELYKLSFGNTNLGRDILGSIKSVKKIDRDLLNNFYKKHYLNNNILITAIGNINHAELVRIVEDNFKNFTSLKTSQNKTINTSKPSPFIGGYKFIKKDIEQSHIAIGFDGVNVKKDDYYAAKLFANIMGGGMSSRLFQEAREKRGLCYGISCFSHSYIDAGIFGIYSSTTPDKSQELIEVIQKTIMGAINNINDDEINKAKTQAKASLVFASESLNFKARQINSQILYFDRIIDNTEIIRKIENVDKNSIAKFVQKLVSFDKPALSNVAPKPYLESSYDNFIKSFC